MGLNLSLSDTQKRELLQLSRATLAAAFTRDPEAPLREFESRPSHREGPFAENLPCFVTLTKKNGRLRGCIGSMVSFNPLYKNVFHMTRQAALEDPRFRPMVESEVPDTDIHIAILGPLRPLKDLESLELGRQGLHISYGAKRGVLLASVAVDNGFDREDFLRAVCEKAGLDYERARDCQLSYFDEISFGEV